MNYNMLRAELERDEGRRLLAYQDSRGYWTIGIGHLLGSSPRMSSITLEECYALLEVDVEEAIKIADRLLPAWAHWDCNDNHLGDSRQRAFLNMIFNRGEGAMRRSTTIMPAIIAASDGTGTWGMVSDTIKASPWAKQVGARATRLAYMFTIGDAITGR